MYQRGSPIQFTADNRVFENNVVSEVLMREWNGALNQRANMANGLDVAIIVLQSPLPAYIRTATIDRRKVQVRDELS